MICVQSVTHLARAALEPLIRTARIAETAGNKMRRKPALVRNTGDADILILLYLLTAVLSFRCAGIPG